MCFRRAVVPKLVVTLVVASDAAKYTLMRRALAPGAMITHGKKSTARL